MVRHSSEFEPGDWSDPRSRLGSTDDVPRWLVAFGAIAAIAIVVALLRYAVDLLGLVSIIVLVGFSIRTLTDWLTDSESVSGWSLVALFAGAGGTAAAGLWLFGSADLDRIQRVEQRLPSGVSRAIEWAEARGWGGRVLLGDERPGRVRAARTTPAVSALAGDVRPRSAGPAAVPTTRAPQGVSSPSRDEGSVHAGAIRAVPPAGGAAAPTTTRLTASPPRSVVGLTVRLAATVTPQSDAPMPEGTVVFKRGSVVVGSAPVEAEGARAIARLNTVDLPVGTHELVAEYVGGGRFATSRSAVVRQVVVED